MRISDLGYDQSSDSLRVVARIAYEDSDRPPFPFFAETLSAHRSAFWPDPNALMLATLLPAWRAGERRLYVGDVLCPVLAHDVLAALHVLEAWYPELGPPPAIEARKLDPRAPAPGPAVGLLSCGIDSLATLRQNRLLLPAGHPLSIGAAVPVVFARNPGEGAGGLDDGRLAAARNVAKDAGIELAPVFTNLWWLVNDGYFYDQKWHGALLAALAHLSSARYSGAYIASSHEGAYLARPWGSSPLLDPFYSSSCFRIRHHGASMTRLQKTALVAEWPAGLDNLRVCQKDGAGSGNCGTCEKCIRVMLALVALGALHRCRAFPSADVSPGTLRMVKEWNMIDSHHKLEYFTELLPRLRSVGRGDLVAVVEDFVPYFEERLKGRW